MEFGASIFFTDYSITSAELAVAMEERGFDSVWAAEHSHIPVPRRKRGSPLDPHGIPPFATRTPAKERTTGGSGGLRISYILSGLKRRMSPNFRGSDESPTAT